MPFCQTTGRPVVFPSGAIMRRGPRMPTSSNSLRLMGRSWPHSTRAFRAPFSSPDPTRHAETSALRLGPALGGPQVHAGRLQLEKRPTRRSASLESVRVPRGLSPGRASGDPDIRRDQDRHAVKRRHLQKVPVPGDLSVEIVFSAHSARTRIQWHVAGRTGRFSIIRILPILAHPA